MSNHRTALVSFVVTVEIAPPHKLKIDCDWRTAHGVYWQDCPPDCLVCKVLEDRPLPLTDDEQMRILVALNKTASILSLVDTVVLRYWKNLEGGR